MDENVIIGLKLNIAPAESEYKSFSSKIQNSPLAITTKLNDAGAIADLKRFIAKGGQPLIISARVSDTGGSIANTSNQLTKLTGSSNAANYALLNLNRVVQDSPYGIIGIANNINPLLESFQRLVLQTGSVSAALKAMRLSMIGPGGIGLAIAAITAALSFATIGLQMWQSRTNKAKKENDQLTESVKSNSTELANNMVKLTALYGITQSHKSLLGDKKLAIQAINQEYKEYLNNIGQESVTLNNVSKAYDLVINQMIRQAVTRGLQDQIAKQVETAAQKIMTLELAEQKRKDAAEAAAKRQITAEQKFSQVLEKRNGILRDGYIAQTHSNAEMGKANTVAFSMEQRIAAIKSEMMQSLAPALKLTDKFSELDVKLNKPAKTKLSEAAEEARAFAEAQKQLAAETEALQNKYDKGFITTLEFTKEKYQLLTKASEDFQVKFGQKTDSPLIKGIDAQLMQLRATLLSFDLKELGNLIPDAQSVVKDKKGKIVRLDLPIEVEPKLGNKAVGGINEKLQLYQKGIELGIKQFRWKRHLIPFNVALNAAQMREAIEQVDEDIQKFSNIVESAMVNGFVTLGQGIGNAIAGVGNFADIFSGVGAVLGDAMIEFGKLMIEKSAIVQAAMHAIESLATMPAAGIVAGIALVAAGTALKAALQKKSQQKISGFAEGGGVYGPTLAWVGEHSSTSRSNPELFGRFDQFKSLFTGVIGDAMKNRQYGVQYAMQPAAWDGHVEFHISGDHLMGVLKRTESRQKRNY